MDADTLNEAIDHIQAAPKAGGKIKMSVKPYKQVRFWFMVSFYAVAFGLYILYTIITGELIEGWWSLGLCIGVVVLEQIMWIAHCLNEMAESVDRETT